MKNDKKEKAAYITALVAFVCGWGLTIAGFIVPPLGDVSNSILAILGEAMIYAASVFGVTLYFRNQMERFKSDAKRYLEREHYDDLHDIDENINGQK